jgi:hypothetical protein
MPTVKRLVTLALIAALVGFRAPRLDGQSCDAAAQVALAAKAALTLPATFGIQGVASAPSGGLVLWSPGGEILRVDQRRTLSRQQLPDSIHPAGMAVTPEGLRLLDLRSGWELLLTPDGRLRTLGRVSFGLSEELDQALWTGDGWILALRDLAGRRFVIRRATADSSPILYRSSTALSAKLTSRYHLTDTGRDLVLVRVTAPFEVIRLDPASRRADTLASPLGGAEPALVPADSLLGHWRALPAVDLDCGLLVTLTDLTSDHRLMVRYDAGGGVAQVTPVAAPIGLVSRLPGEATLLAARRAGELELVWYDWHWIRETHSSTR